MARTIPRREWLAAAGTGLSSVARLRAEPQRGAEPTALIFGTVFKDSYLALPGARVVAYNSAGPRKKIRAVTNYRGEYRVRVPAGDATYVVEASAPRFAKESRTVQVYGIEKSTANLVLQPRKRARRPPDQPARP